MAGGFRALCSQIFKSTSRYTYILKIHVTVPVGSSKKLRVNSEREVESFDEQGRSDKVERCCDVLITWHDGPTSLPRLKAFCKVTLLGCTTCRDAPPFKKETDSGSRLCRRVSCNAH